LEGCTSSNGKLRNTGLSERGNPGDNGVFIVPKFNLNKVRYFSTLSKLNARKEDSLAYLTKINTTDFSELNKLIENNHNKLETINTRILKLMSDIRLLLIAYNKIKSKKGNISKGSNNITLDGINISYLNKLSKDINTNMFKFSPVRRVEIPKTSGGFRPLSVGNPREKIVQESMRIILEIIYNNSFSYYSHGFRPNLSCLTAIIQCKNYMQYCN
jgi:retron-type reverse transcriptase